VVDALSSSLLIGMVLKMMWKENWHEDGLPDDEVRSSVHTKQEKHSREELNRGTWARKLSPLFC
jgi:hypothetical protein